MRTWGFAYGDQKTLENLFMQKTITSVKNPGNHHFPVAKVLAKSTIKKKNLNVFLLYPKCMFPGENFLEIMEKLVATRYLLFFFPVT